jgi:hypothetical protein
MNYLSHIPPDREAIQENRSIEPVGERLRKELEAWLDKNGIVSIFLDTQEHRVKIDIVKLPPNIKPVLTLWGSIYVRDDVQQRAATVFPERVIVLRDEVG